MREIVTLDEKVILILSVNVPAFVGNQADVIIPSFKLLIAPQVNDAPLNVPEPELNDNPDKSVIVDGTY